MAACCASDAMGARVVARGGVVGLAVARAPDFDVGIERAGGLSDELHAATPHPDALLVVYGEACRLGAARLAQAHVVFKHIPYDVKAR